jgi:hypothetical protein
MKIPVWLSLYALPRLWWCIFGRGWLARIIRSIGLSGQSGRRPTFAVTEYIRGRKVGAALVQTTAELGGDIDNKYKMAARYIGARSDDTCPVCYWCVGNG